MPRCLRFAHMVTYTRAYMCCYTLRTRAHARATRRSRLPVKQLDHTLPCGSCSDLNISINKHFGQLCVRQNTLKRGRRGEGGYQTECGKTRFSAGKSAVLRATERQSVLPAPVHQCGIGNTVRLHKGEDFFPILKLEGDTDGDTDGGLWMSGSHLDGAARLPLPMASVAAVYTASAVFVGSLACPFFTWFPSARKFQKCLPSARV